MKSSPKPSLVDELRHDIRHENSMISTHKESTSMARKLEKQQWQKFFDRVSKALTGKRAEIEIGSLALGDQIAAEWLPLIGLTYDPKSDQIEVALENLDHLISRPREVYFEENLGQLLSLAIIDSEGAKQIIRLKDPLMLPAA
jgi:Family of unknown function (DUF5335)